MPYSTAPKKNKPHLTPEKLVGSRFSKETFAGIETALVGFCPRPIQLDRYNPTATSEQYFIHVTPASVEIGEWGGKKFLSVFHVYGGPVASALVEELAYYGIKTILAYGLAGGLVPENQKMGDFYAVERAVPFDGTTSSYTADKQIEANPALLQKLFEQCQGTPLESLYRVQAATSDAIYRETDQYLEQAKAQGCEIVNCDSAHLYAVSRHVGIQTVQCGVLSDVAKVGSPEWESQLSDMLTADGQTAISPLALVNSIIEFYIETMLIEG